MDTRAKPSFPRQTAQWWFDCQAASRKLKRRPSKKAGSLLNKDNSDDAKPILIGKDDNDHPIASASRMPAKSEDLMDWAMHGRPEGDDLQVTSNATDLNSCK